MKSIARTGGTAICMPAARMMKTHAHANHLEERDHHQSSGDGRLRQHFAEHRDRAHRLVQLLEPRVEVQPVDQHSSAVPAKPAPHSRSWDLTSGCGGGRQSSTATAISPTTTAPSAPATRS